MYAREAEEMITNAKLAGRPLIAHDMQRLSKDRNAFFRTIAETGGNLNHPNEYAGAYPNSIETYLLIGDKARALTALNQAYAEHDAYMIFIAVNPALRSLQGDPAFEELERKVGLLSR
jgi:hypothetical protein